jgi:transcriptional regulator with XRE-family HTH domain
MATKSQHDLGYRRLRKRLREWRLEAGFTQRALAAKLKRPHSFVYKSEVGNRRIDPTELARWCVACGVSASDLLDAIGFPKSR